MFILAVSAVDALRVHEVADIDNGIFMLLSVVVKVAFCEAAVTSVDAQSDDNDRAKNAKALIMVMGLVFINMIVDLIFIINP